MPTKNRNLQRKNQRAWYARNVDKQLQWVNDRRKKMRARLTKFKVDLGCLRCDENEACCLVFHHRDPEQKEVNVSQMVSKGWGWDRMMLEIQKCDVVCRNCHAKIHAAMV